MRNFEYMHKLWKILRREIFGIVLLKEMQSTYIPTMRYVNLTSLKQKPTLVIIITNHQVKTSLGKWMLDQKRKYKNRK